MLDTGETKYKHLEEDLHVEISTYGPPVEVFIYLEKDLYAYLFKCGTSVEKVLLSKIKFSSLNINLWSLCWGKFI